MATALKFEVKNAPNWANHIMWDAGLLDDYIAHNGPPEDVPLSTEERLLLMQNYAAFTKTHPYKEFTLEMINDELWVTITETPEVTAAILKYTK